MLTVYSIALSHVISFNNQKRFGSFIFLAPSKFIGIIGEDTYKFLIEFYERVHTSDPLKSHGVAYITYQLFGISNY